MTACVVQLALAQITAPGLASLRLNSPGSLPNGLSGLPCLRGDFPATVGGPEAVADSRRGFAWRLHWFAFRIQWGHGCSLQSPAPHIISQRRSHSDMGGGPCCCPTFFCRPASAPNISTQPLIRRASSDRQLWDPWVKIYHTLSTKRDGLGSHFSPSHFTSFLRHHVLFLAFVKLNAALHGRIIVREPCLSHEVFRGALVSTGLIDATAGVC